jgi:hypothetical protein
MKKKSPAVVAILAFKNVHLKIYARNCGISTLRFASLRWRGVTSNSGVLPLKRKPYLQPSDPVPLVISGESWKHVHISELETRSISHEPWVWPSTAFLVEVCARHRVSCWGFGGVLALPVLLGGCERGTFPDSCVIAELVDSF